MTEQEEKDLREAIGFDNLFAMYAISLEHKAIELSVKNDVDYEYAPDKEETWINLLSHSFRTKRERDGVLKYANIIREAQERMLGYMMGCMTGEIEQEIKKPKLEVVK